jgi:Tol biopolymer transport system component
MRRFAFLAAVLLVLLVGVASALGGFATSGQKPLLVYSSFRGTAAQHDGLGKRRSLYVLRPDGRGLRRLTTSDRSDVDAAWSSGGGLIAYSSGVLVPIPASGGDWGVDEAEIDVLNSASGRVRPLTSTVSPFVDASPTWSPDGRRIAFVRYDHYEESPENGVYVIGTDGQGLRRIAVFGSSTNESFWPSPPTAIDWSPDGKLLAFVAWGIPVPRGPDENEVVALLDPESGKITHVRHLAGARGVAWSPDGRTLAVTREGVSAASRGVFVVPAYGGPARRIVATRYARGVSWSPDGRQLAFGAVMPTGRKDFDIFTVRLDGNGLKRLTANPSNDYSPDWRP